MSTPYADWQNDLRRARWAARYLSAGLHRAPIADCPQPESPWKPTVTPRQPAPRASLLRTGDLPYRAPDAEQASGAPIPYVPPYGHDPKEQP